MNNPFINNNPFLLNNPFLSKSKIAYTPYISKKLEEPETEEESDLDFARELLRRDTPPQTTSVTTSTPEKPETEEVSETGKISDTTQSSVTSGEGYKTYTDRNEFLKDISTAYYRVLTKSGRFTDADAKEYARRLAIKDGLETDFGKSKPKGTFNYGNITVAPGSSASYTEGRDHDANGNPITQRFRNFSSLDDYLDYQINKLYRPDGRYAGIFTGDYSGFYDRLKNAGYAEDKEYASKLNTLYRQYYGNVPIAKYGGVLTKKAAPPAYKRQYDLTWNPFE